MTAYAFLIRPPTFASRSGLYPLCEAVGATPVCHDAFWAPVYDRVWRLGIWLRKRGIAYYGTEWNALAPWFGERMLAAKIQGKGPHIAHFVFAEFSSPKNARIFRKKNAGIVGTFHASVHRQEKVIGKMDLSVFDWITVMCKAQLPYFVEKGFPESRLRVTHHGVDTNYFCPNPERSANDDKPLQGLVVGATERDHAFAAKLMKHLPDGLMELQVATRKELHKHYDDSKNCVLHPFLSDEELLNVYQSADLLIMPLDDATANNAVLESMACGTPVMTNNIGGIPDYVNGDCNFIMERLDVDEWISKIREIHSSRDSLADMRADVRKHAETFDWFAVADQYKDVYQEALKGVSGK